MLDAYVVGFEIEARLGSLMNPRHYQRGWHCTSTLGTIGAAAAVSRLLGLDARTAAARARDRRVRSVRPEGELRDDGQAAACGAGGAQRRPRRAAGEGRHDGERSARSTARRGCCTRWTARATALADAIADLGARWEILDTGITVKLYPSCAGTHPSLDAILDLRRREGFSAGDVERIDIDVDSIVPTILIYDRPATGLEGKFSLPFCAAAAVAFGRVGIDTFDAASSHESAGDGADGARRDAGRSGARSRRSAAHTRARAHHPAGWTRADPGGAGRARLSRTAGQRCGARREIHGVRVPRADGAGGGTSARPAEKNRRAR